MYSTCLFCHQSLGANESIEHFPVGQRLAFDAANRGALPHLPREERLALEMAVHEEGERRALEEEIAPLEEAWRQAEEIAAIADNLLTTPTTEQFIREHKPKA